MKSLLSIISILVIASCGQKNQNPAIVDTDTPVYETNTVEILRNVKFTNTNLCRSCMNYNFRSENGKIVGWQYEEQFHNAISNADRIVIKVIGQNNSTNNTIEFPVFLTMTNSQDIANFRNKIQFNTDQGLGNCLCVGTPHSYWYQGTNLLVCASFHHGKRVSWEGFPRDAELTPESSKEIARWFLAIGIKDTYDQYKNILEE